MKGWLTIFTTIALFALIFQGACCQGNTSFFGRLLNRSRGIGNSPVPTYVGPIERLILLIKKPIDITDNTIDRIGKGLKNILERLPLGKEIEKKGRTGKTVADVLNPFKDKIKAVYPGTLWCGDGDIASNTDDLGIFKRTDACCRAHDSCTGGIPAQEHRYGLLNNGLFTRSPCDCDKEFYNCLKAANSLVATKLGTTYFNILRPQCFKEDYPIVSCDKYTGKRLLNDKCEKYVQDTNAPKKYQWFDNPDFLSI